MNDNNVITANDIVYHILFDSNINNIAYVELVEFKIDQKAINQSDVVKLILAENFYYLNHDNKSSSLRFDDTKSEIKEINSGCQYCLHQDDQFTSKFMINISKKDLNSNNWHTDYKCYLEKKHATYDSGNIRGDNFYLSEDIAMSYSLEATKNGFSNGVYALLSLECSNLPAGQIIIKLSNGYEDTTYNMERIKVICSSIFDLLKNRKLANLKCGKVMFNSYNNKYIKEIKITQKTTGYYTVTSVIEINDKKYQLTDEAVNKIMSAKEKDG